VLSVRLQHFMEGRVELTRWLRRRRSRRVGRLASWPPRSRERRRTVAAFARIGAEDLERAAYHPAFDSTVTLRELLNLWAAHDLQHTVQAEEALMQAFIPGTGVWRSWLRRPRRAGADRGLSRSDGRGELIEARRTCERYTVPRSRSHEIWKIERHAAQRGPGGASGLWLSIVSVHLMDLDAPPVEERPQ